MIIIRRNETAGNYKTLTDDAIKYYIMSDLKALTNTLNDKILKFDRKTLIKIAVALNNILYKIDK